MPSLADIPLTWPPPNPVVLADSKDQISAVRVALLRPITLLGLTAFVQGSGAGAASTQEGKFAIYSHDAGANRPDVLLEESAPMFVGRDDPIAAPNPAMLLAPLDLDPGIYWVALHLAPIVGQGKWQVRGLNTGGRTILQAPALYGSGLPDPFPAGGTVSTGRIALAGVGAPRSLALGSIVGTFIVGDGTLVGQQPQIQDPQLILNGKAFVPNIFTDWHSAFPGKPSLTLAAKQYTSFSSSTLLPEKPTLLLNGQPFFGIIPVYAHMAKAQLLLLGKTFGLISNVIETPGKPSLILQGKPFHAGEVILTPTDFYSIDLIPSVPGSLDLVPTTEEYRDLVPTTEVFR